MAAEGDEDALPFDRSAVAQLHHVSVVIAGAGPDPNRPGSQPQLHSVVAQDPGRGLGDARMVLVQQLVVGVDQRHLNSETGKD